MRAGMSCTQWETPAQQRMDMLAHDLRSSMACVSGAAQMALAAVHQGRGAEAQLQQILLAVGAMDRLLARHCGGSGENCFAAEALEAELRALLETRVREKRQQLIVDFVPLAGAPLRADRAALSSILVNLAGNAVKYTACGGRIVLRGGRVGTAAGSDLIFVVEDNGAGMRPAFLRRLFEPFARAEETAREPGSGLGLAIAERLARSMGGGITVSSEWGRGSIFTVRLPERTTAGSGS